MAETITNSGSVSENFVKNGKVFILGPFDRSISSNVIPEMLELVHSKRSEKDPTLEIYINSHGGMVEELLSILSLVQMAKKFGIKVITYNIGYAYSCGSILAIHGDVRKMYRYADNVAHLGSSGNSYSTFEQVDRVYRFTKEHFGNVVKWYVENTKMSRKEVEEMLRDDKMHLNAEKCLKLGLCDEII